MTPDQAFEQVQLAAHKLVDRQNSLLMNDVLPELLSRGVGLLASTVWTENQREWARGTFDRDVMPLLTPIGLDPAHPFPRVYNKSLNFIVSLSGQDALGRHASIAIVQAPRALPRAIARKSTRMHLYLMH